MKNKGCHGKPSEMVSLSAFAVLGNTEPVLEMKWVGIPGQSIPGQVSSTYVRCLLFHLQCGASLALAPGATDVFTLRVLPQLSICAVFSPFLPHLTSLLFSSDCLLLLSTLPRMKAAIPSKVFAIYGNRGSNLNTPTHSTHTHIQKHFLGWQATLCPNQPEIYPRI